MGISFRIRFDQKPGVFMFRKKNRFVLERTARKTTPKNTGRCAGVLAILTTVLISDVGSANEPKDGELNDWLVYVRSVSIPAVVELCTALVTDQANFASTIDHWTRSNSAAIAKGKDVAAAGLPKGKTLEEMNAALVKEQKDRFAQMTAAEKARVCALYRDTYKVSATQSPSL
jgi:hypothetical protein